jgi:hypothetical protein
MEISINNLWAVAYMNNLTNKIVVHSKLFSTKEEAESFGKEHCGNQYIVNHVFFNNK